MTTETAEAVPPTRKAGLFTSMPEDVQAAAMTRAVGLAPLTGYLVSGETDRREGWLVPIVLRILERAEIDNRGGAFERYDSLPDAVFADGVEPVIHREDLGYVDEVREAMAIFETLEGLPAGTTLRMGLPHVFDMLLAGFPTKIDDEGYRNAFMDSYALELGEVGRQWPRRISYWVETPLTLKMVRDTHAVGGDFEAMATRMADLTAELVGRFPDTVPVDLHLCNGDFGGRGWEDSIDLVPTVVLANAMRSALGDSVGVIHIPTASGNVRTSVDPAFYQPLTALRDDIEVSVGFVHPDVDFRTHAEALRLIEETTGRRVRPASYCGHGRMDVERSVRAFGLIRELVSA